MADAVGAGDEVTVAEVTPLVSVMDEGEDSGSGSSSGEDEGDAVSSSRENATRGALLA